MALVYIVEDDESIREIEKIALENSGHTVVDFYNASSFLKKTKDKVPDLAILDIMLPDMDGYEIVRQLKNGKNTKKIPVIMVTARTTEVDMIRGLDIGADDYIKKPFSVIELITRVKAVLRRTMDKDEATMISVGEVFMDNERYTVYVNNEPAVLTYKEYELLKLLMVNSGIVMTRDVIMDRVWGTEFEGESRTVDMHIKTLRHKLGESGSRIKTIRNVGYVME
jgi:hypothetical protein